MNVTVLTEQDLRKCISLGQDVVNAIEKAYTWLSEEKVIMPAIMHIEVKENKGDVDIKSAYVRGLDSFAVKLGAGFFENYRLGLPNSPAMMVLMSARTGFAEAVLLDNGYLTDLRTGAAGAVAAKHLSCKKVDTVGVFGAGSQGRYQMVGLKIVRDFKRLIVYDIDTESLDKYVQEMAPALGVEVVAAGDPRSVVKESNIVVTSTPSREPYLKPEWLHPGLHITAMGADLPEKQELEPEVLNRVDVLVCDRKSQCFTMGELHHGLEAGILSENSDIAELGEITSGRKPGRQNDEQISLCDLTGTGVQDTAIALLAFQKAIAQGLGVQIDNRIG